jgi:hypothetical protein
MVGIMDARGLDVVRQVARDHRTQANKSMAHAVNVGAVASALPSLPYVSYVAGSRRHQAVIEVATRLEALDAMDAFQDLVCDICMIKDGGLHVRVCDEVTSDQDVLPLAIHPAVWRHMTPTDSETEALSLMWWAVVNGVRLRVRCNILKDVAYLDSNHNLSVMGHVLEYRWRERNYPVGKVEVLGYDSGQKPAGRLVWFPKGQDYLTLGEALVLRDGDWRAIY